MSVAEVILQGKLEKKGRKALQGYSQRYFVLDSRGTLSYSRKQGEKFRDSIDLRKTSVGRNKKRKALVFDSGNTVWHVRCLSTKDFEIWAGALNNFASVRESDDVPVSRPSLDLLKKRQSSTGFEEEGQHLVTDRNASQLVTLISQMASTIAALETVSEQATGQAPYTDPNASTSTVGKALGAVLGSSSTPTLDTKLLESSVTNLKKQHKRILSLLEDTHLASDKASIRSLERAESIASSEYHDAEDDGNGYSYDMEDDGDTASATSSSSGYYHSSSSGEEDNFDDASSTHSNSTAKGGDQALSTGASDNVTRRKQLPHPIAGEEVSLFGLLKKNMGKDISKISMPISLNEPLSQLQTMAEALEYLELLDQAAKTKDSMERLLFVTVFAVSTYSVVKYRSSRKPFNPLLGETYELVRPDKGLKFIAEKVVHHPNWTACHAQGRGWDYTATASGLQKFWGRSFELIPEGISEIRIKETDEVFSFTRPPSFVRNIMSGEKYIEHVGEMVVTNESTGEEAKVNFKEGSSWGGAGSRNKIDGQLYDSNGSAKIEITGKWDESISRKTGSKSSETLWTINDFPNDAPKYYGLSSWAISLNEITSDIKDSLPPTDTRWRPDQRALEEGKMDEAEDGKQKLEAKQRERRKVWEGKPEDAKPPQFFKSDGEGAWHYSGDYWERREKKDWRKDIQIFEM